MNKADLIDALTPVLGTRREATRAVDALVDVVLREVAAGGTVGITGFGTFERAQRAPRTGRNPRTGQTVPIAGTHSPRFRPGTYFKKVVTDPDELPTDGLAGGRAPARKEASGQERSGTASTGTSGTGTSGQKKSGTASTGQSGKSTSGQEKSGKRKSGKEKSGTGRSRKEKSGAGKAAKSTSTKVKKKARTT